MMREWVTIVVQCCNTMYDYNSTLEIYGVTTTEDKRGYPHIVFLFFHKSMLWVPITSSTILLS